MKLQHALCRILSLAAIASLATCSRAELGLPRIHVQSTSPDGSQLAFVRNHPTIDPPAQSLWLRGADGAATQLRRLVGDMDWCHTIVWSADGTRVAFLVQDARLLIADAPTRRIVLEKWLVDPPGGYPPHLIVRDLTLSEDGREATYRLCPRRDPGPCGGIRSLDLEAVRAATAG